MSIALVFSHWMTAGSRPFHKLCPNIVKVEAKQVYHALMERLGRALSSRFPLSGAPRREIRGERRQRHVVGTVPHSVVEAFDRRDGSRLRGC
jgi:hypothetical protein